MQKIDGVIPVMLTPFSADGEVDYDGLERLIEWYLANGSDALFAVCQSSEMQFLSLAERAEIGKFVVSKVAGRVPVVVSGHVSENLGDQLKEMRVAADTGANGIVFVTNRLDPKNAGTEAFKHHLTYLMQHLPADLPLALYECPAPYRRLLSDDEFKFCVDSGRFALLKDVSCDLKIVARRVKMAAGSPLSVINANAAIAYDAMKAGSNGFCGVLTNFHPDLYQWLLTSGAAHPALADEIATTLVLAALAEPFGYPALAKMYHQRLGTFSSIRCRAIDYDVRERFWGLDAILDKLMQSTAFMRNKVNELV